MWMWFMVQIKVPFLSVILCLNPLYMYFYAVNKKLNPNKGMSPHPQPVSTFEYIFFFTYSTAITNNTTTLSSNFVEFPAQITKNNTAELQRKQHKACFGS